MASFADPRRQAAARRSFPAQQAGGAQPVIPVAVLGALVAALLFPTIATTQTQKTKQTSSQLAWPSDSPRVRFEEILEPRSGGTRRFFSRIAGTSHRREGFDRPYGVAWLDGDLLITDPGAGRLVRIGTGGRIRQSHDAHLQSPIGVAACRQGIVVTDSRTGGVLLFDERLHLTRTLAEGLTRPTGVACDGNRIFVAETAAHRILLFDGGVEPTVIGARGAGEGEFNFPTAISAHGRSLWVADTLNFRIQRIDLDSGRSVATFGQLGDAPGEMPRIKGVAADRHGRVWISDGYLDRLSLYDQEGRFLISLGRRGSGPAEFSFPTGIAADGKGRVAVVDSLNRRVHLFESLADGQEGGR